LWLIFQTQTLCFWFVASFNHHGLKTKLLGSTNFTIGPSLIMKFWHSTKYSTLNLCGKTFGTTSEGDQNWTF
jgi:hypothetical protein